MKLSLSGRMFEAGGGYSLPLDQFLSFAKKTGFQGVEIRYPQLPTETTKEKLAEVRQQLKALGLTWAFGTVEGITDDALFERAVRTLDNNLSVGVQFMRFSIFKPEQVACAQRFADAAAQRKAKLVMQVHAGTLPDNVPHALETMRKINRPNVGLAYEPNHLMFDGDAQYVQAVQKLAPHIVAVSLQNFKPAPADAPPAHRIKIGGKEYVRALPGDPQGIDFPGVFKALKAIRFEGYATVMSDPIPGMDHQDVARRWCEYLRGLV